MSDYVPVAERWIRLEPSLQYVEDHLRGIDAALRLRKSLDHPGFHVLERRRMHTPTTYQPDDRLGLCDARVAARDGYVHVSHVHPALMANPLELVTRLRANHNDLGASGNGAEQWWARYQQGERDEKAQRSAQRLDEMKGRAREAYDLMDRIGGEGGTERTRLNSAGFPRAFAIGANEEGDARRRLVAHWETSLTTEDRVDSEQPSRTGDPAVNGGTHEHESEASAGQQDR